MILYEAESSNLSSPAIHPINQCVKIARHLQRHKFIKMKHLHFLAVFVLITCLSACNKDVNCSCRVDYQVRSEKHNGVEYVIDTIYPPYTHDFPDGQTSWRDCRRHQVYLGGWQYTDTNGRIYSYSFTSYMTCTREPL